MMGTSRGMKLAAVRWGIAHGAENQVVLARLRARAYYRVCRCRTPAGMQYYYYIDFAGDIDIWPHATDLFLI